MVFAGLIIITMIVYWYRIKSLMRERANVVVVDRSSNESLGLVPILRR